MNIKIAREVAAKESQGLLLEIAIQALREILKAEGPFSRDPLTHATNVIISNCEIARNALEQMGITA